MNPVHFTELGKRTGAIFCFALCLAFLTGTPHALYAQEQKPPDQKPEAQQPAKPEVSEPRRGEGPARQLAHETREAAGEEKDETEEFKRSPSVMLVSRITGLNPQRAYQFCVVTNFIVIAVVIVWAARKFLPGAFRDRTAAIQKAMQEAQKASEEARRKLAEIESRLMKLDVEIGTMRNAAEKEASVEAARIQAAAHDEAQKILQAAEQEIAAAAKTARRQLTAYAAELAVGLAEKQIRVDAATDEALVRNFAGQLGTGPAEHGAGKGGR